MIFSANFSLGSALLGTAPLGVRMQLTCWILGFMALPINVVAKKIPLEPFKRFTALLDLENEKKEDVVAAGVNRL